MKAALNGALNCSILDGWWDECFDGTNGWAISSLEDENDLVRRDAHEAASLFDLLEQQIVPLFYAREGGPVPRRWIARVKDAFATLGPFVTASRMVRDYTERLYEPAAAAADRVSADGYAGAKALAAWTERVKVAWGDVQVTGVQADSTTAELNAHRQVSAWVKLGSLGPDDADVQLVHGPVGAGEELVSPTTVSLTFKERADDGTHRYEGSFDCDRTGRYGFTVRVLPSHPQLGSPVELGRIAWA